MDKKVIYVVKSGLYGVVDFIPVCAFSTEKEAQRYIDNRDNDYDYIISKLNLYGSYLDYSMDTYED